MNKQRWATSEEERRLAEPQFSYATAAPEADSANEGSNGNVSVVPAA